MTDKDKIKFAIRYLKKGLKSKRTPPLYEELMKELGFVSKKENKELKDKLDNLSKVAEVRLANWRKYEKENAELKVYHKSVCETLTNTHRNIREQLTKAKDLIRNLLRATYGEGWNYSLQVKVEAEKFLKESE